MPLIRHASCAVVLFALACAGTEPSRTAAGEPASIPPAGDEAGQHDGVTAAASTSGSSTAETRTLFGLIARLSESELGFDEAELLTGSAADEAAREAGQLAAGEHVDNDYFIRDKLHELVSLPIAAAAEVHLLKRSGPPDYTSATVTSKTDLAALVRHFQASDPDSKAVRATYYRLTVKAGQVTRVEEVYFP